jgi:DNA anti-recombination protein RmuC
VTQGSKKSLQQSKAKQSKAKQSKAKQSKAMLWAIDREQPKAFGALLVSTTSRTVHKVRKEVEQVQRRLRVKHCNLHEKCFAPARHE